MSERETREDERKGKKGQGAANEEQIDTGRARVMAKLRGAGGRFGDFMR